VEFKNNYFNDEVRLTPIVVKQTTSPLFILYASRETNYWIWNHLALEIRIHPNNLLQNVTKLIEFMFK